jgi:uncharacterized protein
VTSQRRQANEAGPGSVVVAGVALVADASGALYWPEQRLLAVADLHLEKGSSLARRGILLPPYDTADTLGRLGVVIARYAPRLVIALGDSFHDREGPARLRPADRDTLAALQSGREFIWLAGNHDRNAAWEGGSTAVAAIGPLTFRHEPQPEAEPGEVAGHLHPAARIAAAGRTLRRRCYVGDADRLILPAFGAYAGGLNIRHAEFLRVFGALAFTAHLIGERRLYSFAAARCLAD